MNPQVGDLIRRRGPPSQTWRTFLANHATELIALDFLTVPKATFRVLVVLVILSHDRRRILHFNITEYPTAAWTGRQLSGSCGFEESPRFLIRDRAAILGELFRRHAAAPQITEMPTAPRPPWQNLFAERVVGSIRRECLGHVIVFGEHHLKRLLLSYVDCYNATRSHLFLCKDAPAVRRIQPRVTRARDRTGSSRRPTPRVRADRSEMCPDD